MKTLHWLFLLSSLAASPYGLAEEQRQLGKAPLSGEATYLAVCQTCHGTGLHGAPQIGDRAAWAPLIAEGALDLWGSAMTGLRLMPPKGGEPALHDIEVARAVNYLVSQAGGNFPEPSVTSVKRARSDGEQRNRQRLAAAAASRR